MTWEAAFAAALLMSKMYHCKCYVFAERDLLGKIYWSAKSQCPGTSFAWHEVHGW